MRFVSNGWATCQALLDNGAIHRDRFAEGSTVERGFACGSWPACQFVVDIDVWIKLA